MLGKEGEVAWYLLMLLPILPFMLYWGVILIKKSLLEGALVESLLFGMVFVGAAFTSVMFVLLLTRLKNVIQRASVNDDLLIGKTFFNEQFSFSLEDVEDVQALKATRFKNNIGSLSDMVFTIRLKNGTRLSVLDTMDESDALFEVLKQHVP